MKTVVMKYQHEGCGLLRGSRSTRKGQQNGVKYLINARITTTNEHPKTSLKIQNN
jgi:hypothetical protein